MRRHMQALLTHSEAEFDFPRIVSVLVRALHDDNPRVVTVAIEGLAVVHHLIGDDIHALLVASGASVSSRLMLAGRFASTNLPGLKADGAVEHEVRTENLVHVSDNDCAICGACISLGCRSLSICTRKMPDYSVKFRTVETSTRRLLRMKLFEQSPIQRPEAHGAVKHLASSICCVNV